MTWLPPEEYVRTVPNATMYGALYFTDADGNPLGLQSVRSAESWQLPGGNVEHEDTSPFATAVRECREETGIVFTGEPVLLLTHFRAPDAAWPCAKVGFVFDGGTLTREALDGIVLDPAEHRAWQVATLAEWEAMASTRVFRRINALAEARSRGAAGCVLEPGAPAPPRA